MKILFILKERFYSSSTKSYGLINSSNYVHEFLDSLGYNTKVVTVVDGNSIDKEVYDYKPNIVIIEALWVSADKFKELLAIPRYKHIHWVVRIHSDIGFLACESQALKTVNDYITLNDCKLIVSTNNKEFNTMLSKVLNYNFLYLPNIIRLKKLISYKREHLARHETSLHIGCFGSLRLLKNQCFQALCAIGVADKIHRRLFFHITSDLGQDISINPVLNNLKEIFKGSKHVLVIHPWMDNLELKGLIRHMDIGLQLSFSESFNIVAADFVSEDKLIIVSDSIKWMPKELKTSTTDYKEVIDKIWDIYNSYYLTKVNLLIKQKKRLRIYSEQAEHIWSKFLKGI